jgi:hypothetical protein
VGYQIQASDLPERLKGFIARDNNGGSLSLSSADAGKSTINVTTGEPSARLDYFALIE